MLKRQLSILAITFLLTSLAFAQNGMYLAYEFQAKVGSESTIAQLLTTYHNEVGAYKSGGFDVTRFDLNGPDEGTHRVLIYGDMDNFGLETQSTMIGLQFELLQEKLNDHIEKGTRSEGGYLIAENGNGFDGYPYRAEWRFNVSDPATFIPSWVKFMNSDEVISIMKDRPLELGSVAGGMSGETHWAYAGFENLIDYMSTMKSIYASDAFLLHLEEVNGIGTLVREFTETNLVTFN